MLSNGYISLLSVVTTHLFQYATADAVPATGILPAVAFPYNCDSTIPICQNDCQTAVNNICSGEAGPYYQILNSTVGGCMAKYVPENRAVSTTLEVFKPICLAGFQQILDLSATDPAASKCDGKTLPRVGGVLGWNINNVPVPGPIYAISPVANNPNCVVNPNNITAPINSQYSLNGTIYDCGAEPETALAPLLGQINTRDTGCALSITAAAICGADCFAAATLVLTGFEIFGAICAVSCVLCIAPDVWLVDKYCKNTTPKRESLTLGRPAYFEERSKPDPGFCVAGQLSNSALTILPKCVQAAAESVACENADTATS